MTTKHINIKTKKGQKQIQFKTVHDYWIKARKVRNSPTNKML